MFSELKSDIIKAGENFPGDIEKALKLFNTSQYAVNGFYLYPIYNRVAWEKMIELYKKGDK